MLNRLLFVLKYRTNPWGGFNPNAWTPGAAPAASGAGKPVEYSCGDYDYGGLPPGLFDDTTAEYGGWVGDYGGGEESYGGYSGAGEAPIASSTISAQAVPKRKLSAGLRNSVRFMIMMCETLGIAAKMAEVLEPSDIAAQIAAYQPTHAIIEAFWCPPATIAALKAKFPHVHWIVRNHSETPFLCLEGMSFTWVDAYLKLGCELMCNAPRAQADLQRLAAAHGYNDRIVTYGPNWYPFTGPSTITPRPHRTDGTVHIGCFGAIRPLKNHMVQAIAALGFARGIGRNLVFHINGNRQECGGNPVLKNLQALFNGATGHKMVEHDWMDHADFLKLLRTMDICVQASMSETFNIVLADSVCQSVPVIGTAEIPWLGGYGLVDPLNGAAIADALHAVWTDKTPATRLHYQRVDLQNYVSETAKLWGSRFG